MSTKKILFITLARIDNLGQSGIYSDLISKFISEGYEATILCPLERKYGLKSRIIKIDGGKIIQVKSLNIQKTNILEKVISTFLIEFQFIISFLKNCENEKFEIGLFTTPPIFITNFMKILNKKRVKIKYLLLKDIFPQNALDLNITKKYSPFYLYSRYIEKKLYNAVDYIGCMSRANLNYILDHNKVDKKKLEINPNTIDISKYPKKNNSFKKSKELNLVYGGNLGAPQNPILISEFISRIELLEDVFLKIIGSGTEFDFLEKYLQKNKIKKTLILKSLSKQMYFEELEKADIGLIFLNEKFTIPNYPSRLLDYLYFDLAIISNTDKNTDITEFIHNNNLGKCFYGFDEIDKMILEINKFKNKINDLNLTKNNSYRALVENFSIDISFNLINDKFV